jgi:hypothetical protein
MDKPTDPTPQYEPGGDRIMIVIAVIVVTALGGMAWSFFLAPGCPDRRPGDQVAPSDTRTSSPPSTSASPPCATAR